MKRFFVLFAVAAVLFCSCSSDKPAEVYVPKNTVEFAGNAFSAFSLGADVKLYTVQNPENSSEWTLQAVVPVRKEVAGALENLSIDLVPLDDRGVRVRDGLVLEGEDLENLIPVYNSGVNVERIIVFSNSDEDKKYMSGSEAKQLLEKTKGVRMNFNVRTRDLLDTASGIIDAASAVASQVASQVTSAIIPDAAPAPAPKAAPAQPSAPKEYPMTVDGLCRKHGIYGMLSRYESALRNGDRRGAKRIEDQLWTIEKRVRNDKSIPESVRNGFVRYIENKEDEIEDRY